MVENFLELDSGFSTLPCGQIGFATYIGGVEAGQSPLSQFIRNGGLKHFDSLCRLVVVQGM
jgi:hypothetical protein